ncbi:endonuclease/exonuclease/phosphatase [Galdieria sulphuraria]|uniref:Endonuclease/exonuclease/phosphatase n=1 Tax=Galdieria sulphuraria TaxID=130081 RepID=M2Y3T9_GALSU|nr:endonuclease/exonuclease/phosphatase [Galdieria sulphuraria]EME30633.1 endonuclease/exonuclease/phosphatase [Galdieria sulphuraria]|eukprot:XP_005707153.1 endonuclease/exonuclease/phosphatase [Galdieria sulphuraria]
MMIGESKGDQNTSSVDIPSGITGTKRRWKVRSLASTDSLKLRFLQWNILSADFMEGFETVDMNTWTVEHREQLFENQVIDSAPDIICLQEVKSSGDFFCIQSICKRLSEHWQLAGYVPKKHKRDGVAIFYRPQKIRLLSTVAIPLYVEESESQVACLATFEHRSESTLFTFHVINTHLKAKRDNREIRLRQVDALLNALSLWNIDNEKAVVILCGDLNAEPYEATITKLQSFGFQWIYQQMQIDDPILYSSNKKRQGEEYQIRMQDYIFIKSSSQFSIDCESCLLPPLIHAELNALWIPNQEYPSDHWDIVTDLSVTPK